MKRFWNDFKEFISRGNIVDLAVAVVVGGAFGKIVTSLVNNIIMPLISLATGGVSIEDWKWVIKPADAAAGTAESALSYGIFIQSILDFLIIAFFIFLTVRILKTSKNSLDKVANDLQREIKKAKKKLRKNKDTTALESELEGNTNESIIALETPKEINTTSETDIDNEKSQSEILAEIRDILKEIKNN